MKHELTISWMQVWCGIAFIVVGILSGPNESHEIPNIASVLFIVGMVLLATSEK